MGILIFVICLMASTIGGICGIGGGVIIMPTLDAMHIMSVSSISFLSGLTVLSMSVISIFRQRKSRRLDLKISSFLALGAVAGGLLGNNLFRMVKLAAGNDAFVGMVQAIVLGVLTVMTLIYSMGLRRRIPSYRVHNPVACVAIGGLLGVLSSFLGIGGGPINLAVLYFAFSMDTKKAAANSLYIIMFSQTASFVTSLVTRSVPEFSWGYLVLMVTAGVAGGLLGARVNKKISPAMTDKLFAGLLCVITAICIYNACRFGAGL